MAAAHDKCSADTRRSIRLPRPLWIGMGAIVLVLTTIALRVGVPIYRQQVAIREIERLGGWVVTEERGPNWLRRWFGDKSTTTAQQLPEMRSGGTATSACRG